ncbi:hybrid sensor histidine kinase/response regulator transcription factor [Reichenbachiella ulvae]|uniref:histidine kinase n=1 Tax=Reichenbachiella ulvae TaxID=2980104 RepID=A0ABT3D069_9BACT|nr:hybrid sensor histidine kinase/response regulator transcription factor [Reichenbachiella ulvae]MCV9389282.1 response regulator [Reichenbachiella ulvae]
MKRLLTIFILGLLPLIHSEAKDINYYFRHITAEDGLAHTDATDLVQDRFGFVWIATFGGLQRYDGNGLQLFWNDENQLNAVFNNRIKGLHLGENDLLWLSTEGGVKLFDTKINQFIRLKSNGRAASDLLSSSCRDIVQGTDGAIYALLESGLYRMSIQGDVLKTFTPLYNIDLRQSYIGEIIEVNGDLWVVHTSGVLMVKKNRLNERNGAVKIELSDRRTEKSFFAFHSITQVDDSTLLFGCNNGFIEVNLAQSFGNGKILGNYHKLSLDPSTGQYIDVTKIICYDKNEYWIGTNEGLISVKSVNGEYQESYYQNSEYDKNSLTSNHINSLWIDDMDHLWITTFSGGVNFINLNQKQFSILNRDPSQLENTLAENFVRAITSDAAGNMWLGTWSKGLNKYNPKTNTYTLYSKESKDFSQDKIRALEIDHEGRLWVGTNQGLYVKRPYVDDFIPINYSNSDIQGSSFYCLGVDYFGQVWAGSWNGKGLNRINYINEKALKVEVFNTSNSSICSDKITYIYADPNYPQVFIGTNQGMNHILLNDDGQVKSVFQYKGYEGDRTSLSSNFVWPIVKTNDSTLWVGTLGGGLNKLIIKGDGRYRAKHFGPDEGAPSSDIESLELDKNGNLWLGTKGLSKFNPETETFTNYDYNDGLQGNSFKIGSSYAAPDGTLYFGGINGVSYFNPDSITKSSFAPEVVFTDLYINGQKIAPNDSLNENTLLSKNIYLTDKLILNYDQNNVSISFSSMQYSNPQKSRYKYMLKGVDRDWNITQNAGENTAAYQNLDHGSYEFAVVGSNGDGVWGEKVSSVLIEVTPPIWKTFWAKVIYFIIITGALVFVFYSQRRWLKLKRDLEFTILEEQKMEEIHKMRMKFFTNISHEFRTPLTLILNPIEMLMSKSVQNETMDKLHKTIFNNANRLLSLINELMDFRKAETGAQEIKVANDDIHAVLNNITSGFDNLADKKNINYQTRIRLAEVDDFWFDQGVIEKIVLNLISNAFRYTENGSISIEAGTDPLMIQSTLQNHFAVQSEERFNEYLYIKVSDTGIGITNASIKNIFDRYFRISDDNSQHLGSGVGLALVRSLVLLHKGDVIVRSERRVGSEFVVCLPLGKEPYSTEEIIDSSLVKKLDHVITREESIDFQEEDQYEDENGIDESKTRVLLVEDNQELLSFLKDCFNETYHIMSASNGEEALGKVHETAPDIIISDIMMPVMDGLTFCQTLKSDINYSHIPVVLLTAKSADESKIKGVETGADAYLTKPFNLTLLQKTVENILDNRNKLKDRYRNDTFIEEREMVSNKKDQEFMDQLIEIVNVKMNDPAFDIDHLCLEMGNSRTKLYNKIKSLTGLSVGEFIRRMRMKKSAEILLKEQISVSEVMVKVGIQSQSYFTKTFKKEFGVTPAQYKNSVEKEGETVN